MPELYIIDGSNGAGKSSTGSEYIPKVVLEKAPVFDGDKLFMEKRHELWKNIRKPAKARTTLRYVSFYKNHRFLLIKPYCLSCIGEWDTNGFCQFRGATPVVSQ
jgi:predicted ABC-type ATPase